MRVLIHNYSTSQTTEPLYLTEAFNAIEGVTANIWSAQVNASTFDVFDSFKPDLFITDIKMISNDIFYFLLKPILKKRFIGMKQISFQPAPI